MTTLRATLPTLPAPLARKALALAAPLALPALLARKRWRCARRF